MGSVTRVCMVTRHGFHRRAALISALMTGRITSPARLG